MPCVNTLLNHLGDGKHFHPTCVVPWFLLNHLGDGKLEKHFTFEWDKLLNHLGDGKHHPNYKVLVVDGSGLVMCTSTTRYNVGTTVFISDGEIKRLAASGDVVQIEV